MSRLTLLTPLLGLALWACGSGGRAGSEVLEGGVLATFQVEGETFRTWVTKREAIEALEELHSDTGSGKILLAALQPGSGRGAHNAPWSWHLDPEAVHVQAPIGQGCSDSPSHVEANLDRWLRRGHYCPVDALLVELEDFR